MAKKINDELFNAYKHWIDAEKKSKSLHETFQKLAIKHIGKDKWDALESGKLIVELCRKRLNEDGVSSNGRTEVSGTSSEGSNPSAPKDNTKISKTNEK